MIYASLALFLVYLTDVILGAFGQPRFLSDVQECLVLMAATFIFVIDTLRRQTKYEKKNTEIE